MTCGQLCANEPFFYSKVLAYRVSMNHNLNQVLSYRFLLKHKAKPTKTPNQTKTKTILESRETRNPCFFSCILFLI